MTAPSIMTDLLAYNFNLETTEFLSRLGSSSRPLVGQSFMHELAREGDVLSAELLMNTGSEIDLPDEEGRRPLHEAAFFARLDMVRFLLKNGAVLDAPIHPFGYTALYYAVQQGAHDVVRFLVTQGAQLGVVDRLSGQGLLHLVALKGDIRTAGLLIAGGIDVFQEDKRGMTALDCASKNGWAQLADVLRKVMQHHARYGA